jgi:prolyl 4-hydroxylase
MVSVEDSSLRGAGQPLKESIWNAARSTIQEWTNEQLTECSLYGIRVYTEGAMLNTHVDRLPLVSSAILNVAQDVDEPWPLELIGHDGKAHNLTMEPGDMILYESHSILHGRPFPLKGRYMALMFVHFEPTGHSIKHHNHDASGDFNSDVHQQYRDSVRSGMGGHEAVDRSNNGLPPYLIPNSPEEANYRQHHPETKPSKTVTTAHTLAKQGRANELIQLLDDQNHLVHAKDDNGWTPLHEGARAGHVDVVKYLVEKGANVNERSQNGKGGNALFYAYENHGKESAVYQFLETTGAVPIYPDPEL